MIDIIESVVDTLETITGLSVYRRWPDVTPTLPVAIVSRISSVPVLTDTTGADISARVTYAIDIYSWSILGAESMAEQVVNRLATYNLHRTGYADGFDEGDEAYRITITVSGIVDRRGNTFTS